MQRALLIVLLSTQALVGCLGDAPGEAGLEPTAEPVATTDAPPPRPKSPVEVAPCEHPYPCDGDQAWPAGLTGPFEILGSQRVTVESFDGTTLAGALWLPDVPEGVRIPVVIESSPYPEQLDPPADSWDYLARTEAFGDPHVPLLHEGIGVAIFNVRGTGQSGGCFDFWGLNEQRDQAALVDWAAAQPWSNGRVGMVGVSYPGTTPWQAAVQAPPALKTIVVGGIIVDGYHAAFTPQGAEHAGNGAYAIGFGGAVAMGPRVGALEYDPPSHAEHPGAEACPHTLDELSTNQQDALRDDRDATWIEDRALLARLGNVSASVLYTAGYEDGSAHLFQDDAVWEHLGTEAKRFVTGHWGHRFPVRDDIEADAPVADFRSFMIEWFAYWLQGRGDAERLGLGLVDYETAEGTWLASTSWPPAESNNEVLYLSTPELGTTPSSADALLVNAPVPLGSLAALCSALAGSAVPNAHVAMTTVDEPVALAGNPMAYLELSSNRPGGTVGIQLVHVPAEVADCSEDSQEGIAILAHGAADLRFHAGNLAGADFPVDSPTHVRVDLTSTGMALDPGDRLAVLVTWEGLLAGATLWPSTLTVHGGEDVAASHIVLPIVQGSLGGEIPGLAYPPRPVPGR